MYGKVGIATTQHHNMMNGKGVVAELKRSIHCEAQNITSTS
jgi:hypothetical protein